MAILELDAARAHCRLDSDYPASQLQPYIDAAQNWVVGWLNREVYEDDRALQAAKEMVPATLGAAHTTYEEALAGAHDIENEAQRLATLDIALADYQSAQRAARRVMDGLVVNGAIRAAMLLMLGNLFEHREADVLGGSNAVALPTGVSALLRPYRLVQMP